MSFPIPQKPKPPKPYYDDGRGIVIYHGDNIKIIPTLKKMDLIITSPPYNIGNVHHNNKIRHSPYPDNMPEFEYQALQTLVLESLFEKADNGFYNHKNRIRDGSEISPRAWIAKTRWIVRQSLVWINGGPNHDPCRFFPKTERIYWLSKPGSPWLENRSERDVIESLPDRNSLTGQGHTRTFPVDIAHKLITVCPFARDIIDPYMGSGTTLRAAKDLGLRAIGIEIEEKYCEIAARRLQQEVLL